MAMALRENAQMALTTLRENKMRSFLTVLGVVIGITALLSVVAVLMGVYNDVNAFLSDFGSDTLFIFKFDPAIHTSGRLSPEERTRKPLTLEDAQAIGEQCPDVKAVSAAVMPKIVTKVKKLLEWITTESCPRMKSCSIPKRNAEDS
jgi:putative ABC transport system permease protein